jgi:SlyX protein
MDPNDINQPRLTDLEIKVSYQEDLLDQLNQVIVRQQQEIDWLMREVRQLREQVPEGAGQAITRDGAELPPHY